MLISLQYKAARKSLVYIKNIFEGYDNLLLMSMVDAKNGVFNLIFSESMSTDAMMVIKEIKIEVGFEEVYESDRLLVSAPLN